MFDDVRRRVREELQRLEIDACLATTPANIYYTTGFFSPVVNLSFRLMGTDMAIIPADPALPPALLTSDFAAPAARAATSIEDVRTYRMWVENRDLDVITGASAAGARIARPPQWNPDELDAAVTSMLEERGLSAGGNRHRPALCVRRLPVPSATEQPRVPVRRYYRSALRPARYQAPLRNRDAPERRPPFRSRST